MPLAPLPASNTKRYFIGQTASGKQHHIQVRVVDSLGDAAALAYFHGFCDAVKAGFYADVTFNELLVAEKGSDIRNPVAGWTTVTGTALIGNQPDTDIPLTLCARGRSTSGRKVRAFFWGAVFTRTDDWLLVPTPESELDAILTDINSNANAWLAIDGTSAVYQGNYTIQYNDHWVKEQRV